MTSNLADHMRKTSVAEPASKPTSIAPDETLIDRNAAEKLANAGFRHEVVRGKKSKRQSVFGGVFKKKELTEEEIKRRMALLGAGDGAGRGAAW